MSAGSPFTHSSMGVSASTVISSLPLGSLRTLPGVAGPSGITRLSRCTPSASVISKIASISFIVTTSSIDARPPGARADLLPRRVLDGNAVRPALACHALLGLARNEDLLGAGGERRRAHEAQKVGHLRVKVRQGQEALRVDADHQSPVRRRSLGLARGARA